MRKVLLTIILILAWGGASAGDLISTNGGNWLRLSASPCTHEGILSQLKADFRDQFQAGSAHSSGIGYAVCWIERDGLAFVVFEDGDRGIYPMSAFKPVPTT